MFLLGSYTFLYLAFTFVLCVDAGIDERSSYTRSACEVKSGAVKQTEPTVVFDFSQLRHDHEIKKLTKHEFGHALGLYHEHQNPAFLDVMRHCYQDPKQMMKAGGGLKMKLEDFKLQNLDMSDYDPDFVKDVYDRESIMHYRSVWEQISVLHTTNGILPITLSFLQPWHDS